MPVEGFGRVAAVAVGGGGIERPSSLSDWACKRAGPLSRSGYLQELAAQGVSPGGLTCSGVLSRSFLLIAARSPCPLGATVFACVRGGLFSTCGIRSL